MTYSLDPEVDEALAQLAAGGTAPVPARGDWQTLRKNGTAGQTYMASMTPAVHGVTTTKYHVTASDGVELELRWYQNGHRSASSAVVYAHGGGVVLGNLDTYDSLLSC